MKIRDLVSEITTYDFVKGLAWQIMFEVADRGLIPMNYECGASTTLGLIMIYLVIDYCNVLKGVLSFAIFYYL